MKYLLSIFALLLVLHACKKEDDVTSTPSDTIERNEWIFSAMKVNYLWESKIPTDVSPSNKPDTKEFFYNLLYKDDHWSYITDDFSGLIDALYGVYKDFGFTYSLMYMHPESSGSNDLVGIVQYVIPGSPAAQKNMKRGDIFNMVNGTQLTTTNFSSVLESDSYALEFVVLTTDMELVSNNRMVEINAIELEEDPIHTYSVLETNGTKVGYLMYNAFIYSESDSAKLVDVFRYFDEQNISELVLDLRYNGGGATYIATMIASMIVGQEHMENKDIFYSYIYNEGTQNYFKTVEGEESPNLRVRFTDVPVNLNLSNLYVLTLGGTASASELIINGLDPYMTVVQIGDDTYGKYTVSIPMSENNLPSDKWGILPIIAKSVNSKGVTDFKDGFAPDFYVDDDFWHPLGDKKEAMLNVALSYINGTVSPQRKSLILPKKKWIERRGGNTLLQNGIMTIQPK